MEKVALALTIVLWICWHLVWKTTMRHLSPYGAQVVYGVCSVVMLPVWYWLSRGTKMEPVGLGLAAIGYVMATLAMVLYSYALTRMPVSTAILFTAGYPAVIAIMSVPIYGEQMTWSKAIGMVLVVGGVILTSR